MSDNKIAVLLVDDHAVLRAGLRALLDAQPDMCVVGEADSAEQAFRLVEEIGPEIVVMDLGMPGRSAFDTIHDIRQRWSHVKIVVLSMHKGREIVTKALQAGADGYVPKSSAHTDLLQAIRVVHAGERYLDRVAASAVVDALQVRQDAGVLLEGLSEREVQVLRLTAMGYTSREIGDHLSISPKTVDTYRQRVMEKLNLQHRSDVIRFALRAKLLDDDPNAAPAS